VGANGVTDAVVAKTDAELENHELLKVKVDGDREVVSETAEKLTTGTRGQLVQIIGKTLILYRRRKKQPTIRFPKEPDGD
jgi:RNA-binding protein